jgi:hypothetical protein
MRLLPRAARSAWFPYAAGMTILLALTFGATAPALADPTSEPSESSTPTASASPPPTITGADPATTSTPSAGSTSASTPASSAEPTTAAGSGSSSDAPAARTSVKRSHTLGAKGTWSAAAAARKLLRGRVGLLASKLARTQAASRKADGRVSTLAAIVDEDERLAVSVITGCVANGATTSADIVVQLLVDEPLPVSYVVRDDQNTPISNGSFSLVPATGLDQSAITVSGLAAGSYSLELFVGEEGGEPAGSFDFDVLGCLRTTVSCQAITFDNPAGNPAVVLNVSGDDPDGGSSDATFTLAPGAAKTVRTGRTHIDWFAGTATGSDDSQVIALAGDLVGVPIPQRCGDPATTVRIGCSAGGAAAGLSLSISHLPGETLRWLVVDRDHSEIASRTITGTGGTLTRFTVRLPGPGRYTYLLYVNGTGDVLESFGLRVRPCPRGLADTGSPAGLLGVPLAAAASIVLGLALLRSRRSGRSGRLS